MLRGSYHNGFAPRDGMPLYPSLWEGCVGAWAPCLGPTGLTLRDWSGYGNHGTLTNMDAGTDWIASDGRYALDFDGTNDYVNCGAAATLTGNMSVSFWFKKPFSSLNLQQAIASNAIATSSTNYAITVGYSGNPGGIDWWQTNSGPTVRSASRVDDSLFHHVLCTRSGISGSWEIKIYIDGRIDSESTTALNPQNPASPTTTLGRYGGFASYYVFGSIDDVIFYNRAVSANEARLLASRRGIAYDLAPFRMPYSEQVAGFQAAWALRQRLILGGGGGLG